MHLADTIRPYLPFLRRYTRALTGSQRDGDAMVKAALEALLADRAIYSDDLPTKVALYRLLHRSKSAMIYLAKARANQTGSDTIPLSAPMQDPTALRRQAFLLSTLEEFSDRDIACILDIDLEEVSRLMDEEARTLGDLKSTQVLIIEDEVLVSMELSQIVKNLGHDVAAIVTTHDDAVAAFNEHRPGLVLADIQLADGSSGIDAVADILGTFSVPVVFVTAFPERLLTGERVEPTFLITKPFQANAIHAAIVQALTFQKTPHPMFQ